MFPGSRPGSARPPAGLFRGVVRAVAADAPLAARALPVDFIATGLALEGFVVEHLRLVGSDVRRVYHPTRDDDRVALRRRDPERQARQEGRADRRGSARPASRPPAVGPAMRRTVDSGVRAPRRPSARCRTTTPSSARSCSPSGWCSARSRGTLSLARKAARSASGGRRSSRNVSTTCPSRGRRPSTQSSRSFRSGGRSSRSSTRRATATPQTRRRARSDSDGLVGWRKLALRSQDSLVEWKWDPKGGLQAMVQSVNGRPIEVPIQKALLFRTTVARGNPEGRSISFVTPTCRTGGRSASRRSRASASNATSPGSQWRSFPRSTSTTTRRPNRRPCSRPSRS